MRSELNASPLMTRVPSQVINLCYAIPTPSQEYVFIGLSKAQTVDSVKVAFILTIGFSVLDLCDGSPSGRVPTENLS